MDSTNNLNLLKHIPVTLRICSECKELLDKNPNDSNRELACYWDGQKFYCGRCVDKLRY